MCTVIKLTKPLKILGIVLTLALGTYLSFWKNGLFNLDGWGDFVLFLTLLVVTWYTIETMQLRKASFQNFYGLLCLSEHPTREGTNFAGLSMPSDGRKNINFRIFLTNQGTASLRVTNLVTEGCSHMTTRDGIAADSKFEPRGFADWENQLLAPKDTIELDFMISVAAAYMGEISLRLAVLYTDNLGTYKHRLEIKDCNVAPYPVSFSMIDQGKIATKYSGF